MDQEVIYKALRGEATPDELEQVARWHSENPEDFSAARMSAHADRHDGVVRRRDPSSKLDRRALEKGSPYYRTGCRHARHRVVRRGYISKERTYDMLAEQINTLQVPYGQRLKFTLPDGSSVQLNSGAKIEYPSVFKRISAE